MTNFEKYKDDLIKTEGDFAFNKNTRKVVRCDRHINCKDCLFISRSCSEVGKIQWLYEECEPLVLSDDELELIKAIGKVTKKEYKYAARDADGVIRLYETKPCTDKSGNYYGEYTYADIGTWDRLFSNITHKDGLYDIENKCFIKEKGDD